MSYFALHGYPLSSNSSSSTKNAVSHQSPDEHGEGIRIPSSECLGPGAHRSGNDKSKERSGNEAVCISYGRSPYCGPEHCFASAIDVRIAPGRREEGGGGRQQAGRACQRRAIRRPQAGPGGSGVRKAVGDVQPSGREQALERQGADVRRLRPLRAVQRDDRLAATRLRRPRRCARRRQEWGSRDAVPPGERPRVRHRHQGPGGHPLARRNGEAAPLLLRAEVRGPAGLRRRGRGSHGPERSRVGAQQHLRSGLLQVDHAGRHGRPGDRRRRGGLRDHPREAHDGPHPGARARHLADNRRRHPRVAHGRRRSEGRRLRADHRRRHGRVGRAAAEPRMLRDRHGQGLLTAADDPARRPAA